MMLINPYPEAAAGINEATIYPPLGLAYIASMLRNNNIKVRIIDANILKLSNNRVLKIVSLEKPSLVGISLNLITAKSGIELSRSIKKTTDIDICLGGPFASCNIEYVLKRSQADFIIFGEGEKPLLEICKGESLSKVKGIAWKSLDNNCVINEPAEMIQNLDEIPIPSYDLLPPFRLYRSRIRKSPMACIFTSRGCPYQCTFCNRNIFGKKFRAFSAKRVIEEMGFLISKYGVKQIDILDDNFTQDLNRAEEILDLVIKKKFKILINLQNGIRVDNITYPFIKKMKKAGVFKVGIGCESANIKTLKEIKKTLDLDKVEQALKWFRKEGIITFCFFIFGFPNDTQKTIEETINFALEADPSNANFMVLIPFPGTEIYSALKNDDLIDNNLIDGVSEGFFGGRLYHRCKYISQEEILNLQAIAYRRFYLRWQKLKEILFQIRSLNELNWYLNVIKGSFPIIKRSISNGDGSIFSFPSLLLKK